MTWRFLNTGFRRGKFNMEFDEYLAGRLLEGKGSPTLRVFGWSPYAVSLGYHQSEDEIDLQRCAEEGIDVVRRPTGGRAILHAHEVTYSVVMPGAGRKIMDVYRHISRALVVGIRHLGVDAQLSDGSFSAHDSPMADASAVCFASTSRFEIQCDGKKLVGSAQRRYGSALSDVGEVVLQHGSVLLGPQHRRLVNLIASAQPRTREIVRLVLDRKTTEVETILQRRVSFEEAAEAIRRGFEDTCGVEFDNVHASEPASLTAVRSPHSSGIVHFTNLKVHP